MSVFALDGNDLDVVKRQRDVMTTAFNILIVAVQEIDRSLDLTNEKEMKVFNIIKKARSESLNVIMGLGIKK